MTVTHVVGIDPGLVHTGVVRLEFISHNDRVVVSHEAIAGPDAQAVKNWIDSKRVPAEPHIFIEKYQPRSNFSTDPEMTKAVVDMHRALPGSKVLLNTGVKKVIRRPIMALLSVWSFPTVTNHQDLRSAARIALFGMAKDEQLNRVLADVVRDHLDGRPWDVRH